MSQLIVALDLPTVEDAVWVTRRLKPVDVMFKIGPTILYRQGVDELFYRLEGRLMLDVKLNDVPSVMKAAVGAAAARGVSLMTLGEGVTEDQVRAAVSGQFDGLPKLLVVTRLTSRANTVKGQMVTVSRALEALQWGADGVVASGYEVEEIRWRCGGAFLIVCPGIRPAGSEHHEQSRVVTPAEARKAGASHIIVGRPIVQTSDVLAATRTILMTC